jgi:hypothetical protein
MTTATKTTTASLQKQITDLQNHHKKELSELHQKYDEKIESLLKTILDIQKSIPAIIADTVKNAVQTAVDAFKEITKSTIIEAIEKSSTTMEKNFATIVEKKEKGKNLVLVGLPEGDENSDWDRVCYMAEKTGITNPTIAIKTIYRDGMEGRKNVRGEIIPRIIKIKFANKQYREKMLKFGHYKELGSDFTRAYVRRDMTFEERQHDKELRTELMQRRQTEGNPNLIIRDGGIVDKTALPRRRGN